MIIAVLALLPVAYVFSGFWAASAEATRTNTVQRVGAEYVRPLTTLLATMVDAQDAAVRGEPPATDPVREAIGQVNRVDQASGDPLGVSQRWSQLRGEIESKLGATVSGPAAVGMYTETIGLTQALFGRISDTSMITSSPGADSQYLIDTAFAGVPEIMASSGEIAGLARSAGPPAGAAASRIAIVLDRISRATQAIRIGPHSGADQTVAGMATIGLLEPLDEFAAAADGLTQLVSTPGFPARQSIPELDRALRRARQAALGLDTAVLDALNAMLDRRLAELNTRHRNTVIAGVLILGTEVALLSWLWLISNGSNRRHPNPSDSFARNGFPNGQAQRGQAQRGHEQLEPERAGVGSSAQAPRPREAR